MEASPSAKTPPCLTYFQKSAQITPLTYILFWWIYKRYRKNHDFDRRYGQIPRFLTGRNDRNQSDQFYLSKSCAFIPNCRKQTSRVIRSALTTLRFRPIARYFQPAKSWPPDNANNAGFSGISKVSWLSPKPVAKSHRLFDLRTACAN